MKNKWEEAKKEYQDMKESGQLDEIEPISDTVHEKAKKTAKRLLQTSYTTQKEWQMSLRFENESTAPEVDTTIIDSNIGS